MALDTVMPLLYRKTNFPRVITKPGRSLSTLLRRLPLSAMKGIKYINRQQALLFSWIIIKPVLSIPRDDEDNVTAKLVEHLRFGKSKLANCSNNMRLPFLPHSQYSYTIKNSVMPTVSLLSVKLGSSK